MLTRGLDVLCLATELAIAAVGIISPVALWRSHFLAVTVLSILMISIYLHSLFGVGITASLLLLDALLINQWLVLERFGLQELKSMNAWMRIRTPPSQAKICKTWMVV